MRLVVVGTIQRPLPGGWRPQTGAGCGRVSAHPNDCLASPFTTGGDGTDATGAYGVVLTAGGSAPRLVCAGARGSPSESPFVGTGVGEDDQRLAGPDETPDTLRVDLTLARRAGF